MSDVESDSECGGKRSTHTDGVRVPTFPVLKGFEPSFGLERCEAMDLIEVSASWLGGEDDSMVDGGIGGGDQKLRQLQVVRWSKSWDSSEGR